MPELPEVETVMRALRVRLEGRVIAGAVVRRADLRWPLPPDLAEVLTGARVRGFRRRGKYILMRLDPRGSAGGTSLLIHLGMSGRMNLARGEPDAPVAHEHAVLTTDDGWRVGLVDPRRFGALDLVATASEEAHRLLAGLGPEPLEPDWDGAALVRALAGRATPLKSALLDQGVVAGLGNIYVCEALFRARLSPRRLAGTVGRARAARLVACVKETLVDAIAAGGSSLRDYVQPDGELGYFQHAWRVYNREGQACERCPGPPACAGIARFPQGGRSTFACTRTQR